MEFVRDRLFDGRAFRMLIVIDQWSRESVMIETTARLDGASIARAPKRWVTKHSVPTSNTVDQGTEFTSKALETWAWGRALNSISRIQESLLNTDP